MKKTLFALLLLLGAFAAEATAQVRFETGSTDIIRRKAAKTGKLVFIDLYASWCPPCQAMDRHVFSRKDVGEFMEERFVCAKYDTDQPTGKELLRRYGRGSIPTYLVFDTEGELLGRIMGASAPDEFMDDLRTIIARQKPKEEKR